MTITGELRYQVEGDTAQLKFKETDEGFLIETVFVPARFRGQGVGSELMLRVLRLADAGGKPVRLVARPIGTSKPEALARLIAFYERFGFAVVEGGAAGTANMLRPAPALPLAAEVAR